MAKKKVEEEVLEEVKEEVTANDPKAERLAYLYDLMEQLKKERITRMSDLENRIVEALKE